MVHVSTGAKTFSLRSHVTWHENVRSSSQNFTGVMSPKPDVDVKKRARNAHQLVALRAVSTAECKVGVSRAGESKLPRLHIPDLDRRII